MHFSKEYFAQHYRMMQEIYQLYSSEFYVGKGWEQREEVGDAGLSAAPHDRPGHIDALCPPSRLPTR